MQGIDTGAMSAKQKAAAAAAAELAKQQKMVIRMLRAEAAGFRASMLEASERIGGLESEAAAQQAQLWEAEQRLSAAAEAELQLKQRLERADLQSVSAKAKADEKAARAAKQVRPRGCGEERALGPAKRPRRELALF